MNEPKQVARTPEQIAKGLAFAKKVFDSVDHLGETDTFTRDIMEFVARVGMERGMSQEQQVFAIATATIHLRQTFPGGKARFDEVCGAAQEHYNLDG
jgi:hypothetical protein